MDDTVAGMTGLLGATMLAGVGTAAGMATVRMIENMNKPPKRRTRRRR
jgi:hypothetical protein